jgi:hypothetical protein
MDLQSVRVATIGVLVSTATDMVRRRYDGLTARCSFLLRLARGARPHLSPFSPFSLPTIAPAKSCASVILVSLPFPLANDVDVGAARCRGWRREVGRDLSMSAR